MKRSGIALFAALAPLLAAASALAQLPPPPPAHQPPPAPAQPKKPELTPSQRMISVPSGKQVIFETMARTGPDGKVIRLDMPLDLASLQRNPLMDEAARQKARPVVKEWMADVERIAIDNLDFLERIEPADGKPGVIATLDSASTEQTRFVGQMLTQLGAASNLNSVLQSRGVLTPDQHNLNQHITAEYLQRIINEVAPPTEQIKDEAQRQDRTNRYNRFLYSVSVSDVLSTYHRLMTQAADKLPELLAAVKAPDSAPLKEAAARAAGAADDTGRREAVRGVLSQLSFEQRQELLRESVKRSAPFEPFSQAPTAQTPSATSTSTPAKAGG